MKKILRIVSIIMLLIISSSVSDVYAAENARTFLTRVASTLGKSGSLQATFTCSGAMSTSGTITAQGKQFSVVSSVGGSWYDGSALWSYNPQSEEATVVTPTTEELRESNPMMYVNAGDQFDVAFASTSSAGTKTLNLTPKNKKSGIKSVTIIVNTKTMYPTKITVTPSSGKSIVISVGKVTLGKKYNASTFTFPRSKYPKSRIIDLR